MDQEFWTITDGDSPIIAAAIHNGDNIHGNYEKYMEIPVENRLREEDPFTGLWTGIAKTTIVGRNSRFQVDLNRPRDKAVYIKPEDSWGLKVWKETPSQEIINQLLKEYDQFYLCVEQLLRKIEKKFGRFIILDLHTYNHRREGPNGPIADEPDNPEINIGTGTINKELWGRVVDRFISDLRSYDFLGRKLDVRENIKFKGGHFSRWVHEKFPHSGCAIAIEVKKFFMDEWTTVLDQKQFTAVRSALASTIPNLMEVLNKSNRR